MIGLETLDLKQNQQYVGIVMAVSLFGDEFSHQEDLEIIISEHFNCEECTFT